MATLNNPGCKPASKVVLGSMFPSMGEGPHSCGGEVGLKVEHGRGSGGGGGATESGHNVKAPAVCLCVRARACARRVSSCMTIFCGAVTAGPGVPQFST